MKHGSQDSAGATAHYLKAALLSRPSPVLIHHVRADLPPVSLHFLSALLVARALAGGDLVKGPPLCLHSDEGIAGEHGARDVAGVAHDHFVAGCVSDRPIRSASSLVLPAAVLSIPWADRRYNSDQALLCSEGSPSCGKPLSRPAAQRLGSGQRGEATHRFNRHRQHFPYGSVATMPH